jgi:UrcA family protein
MIRVFTAASVLALTVSSVQAAPGVGIQVGDLDLSKPSDVRVLETRVHQAANRVCGPLLEYSATSLSYQTWYNQCMHVAGTEAARQVEARAGQYGLFARK